MIIKAYYIFFGPLSLICLVILLLLANYYYRFIIHMEENPNFDPQKDKFIYKYLTQSQNYSLGHFPIPLFTSDELSNRSSELNDRRNLCIFVFWLIVILSIVLYLFQI